ncbi:MULTISPECIES: hypothetical protein [Spirulina sp. CCY15215]|uniref:hypothetical protein n=1 Tax=Spirulina sp. CCY15215 TaxID=2767591 RepID=UPI00194E5A74|nr:hypothetical protein [Spirulina major]
MVKINGRVPDRGDIIRLELNPRTGSEQAVVDCVVRGAEFIEVSPSEFIDEVMARLEPLVT